MKNETPEQRQLREAAARSVLLTLHKRRLHPLCVEVCQVFMDMQLDGFTAEEATTMWIELVEAIVQQARPS